MRISLIDPYRDQIIESHAVVGVQKGAHLFLVKFLSHAGSMCDYIAQ
ncbi:MAG: hypothetical protein PSV13_09060 [Lacunisphaera sp.]|nr:hypothetical protein [Lacunisphaera sp.]